MSKAIQCLVGVFAFFLLVVGFVSFGGGQTIEPVELIVTKPFNVVKVEINVNDLWLEVNDYRVSKGLNALALSPGLNTSAINKCNDMVERDYWSHNTPDGKEPFDFFIIDFYMGGENLAYGFDKSNEVVEGWKNSPLHNENLLIPTYDKVGYGVCDSNNYLGGGEETIVVQHLAG
jgi:uncharacterized protein YkwD